MPSSAPTHNSARPLLYFGCPESHVFHTGLHACIRVASHGQLGSGSTPQMANIPRMAHIDNGDGHVLRAITERANLLRHGHDHGH
mmetsp:Transcript_8376/g.18690  ORF Transcript_8376/g.18690 Transcript_8376/m.18690 type:complete len:85 (+) Transcript_8376:333-587(+)